MENYEESDFPTKGLEEMLELIPLFLFLMQMKQVN